MVNYIFKSQKHFIKFKDIFCIFKELRELLQVIVQTDLKTISSKLFKNV